MSKAEKVKIIRELSSRIAERLCEKVDQMPEEWDGHELRVLLADAFTSDAQCSLIKREPRSKRSRDYKNETIINNY